METEQKIKVGKNQRNKKTFLSLKKSICFHIERISEVSNITEKRLALNMGPWKVLQPQEYRNSSTVFLFYGDKRISGLWTVHL